jgi:dCMP deaminase
MNGYGTVYGKMQPVENTEDVPVIDLLAETRPTPAQIAEEQVNRAECDLLSRRSLAADLKAQIEAAQQEMARLEKMAAVVTERPSRDEFFFQMAELASTMATCPRAHCGAVIVRNKRVLSLGYNGAVDGADHCPSEGEALAEHLVLDHCDRSIHAEINSLRNAIGNVYGATIYVYGHYRPCPPCAAELNRVGITDIRHRPGPRVGPEKNWG